MLSLLNEASVEVVWVSLQTAIEVILKDHSRKDSTAVAFLNNMKQQIPTNVILGGLFAHCLEVNFADLDLGNKNKAAPTNIPHRYCVLDYFKVTDTWFEKANGTIVIFYRLEKLFL